jgi:hypothetical protein
MTFVSFWFLGIACWPVPSAGEYLRLSAFNSDMNSPSLVLPLCHEPGLQYLPERVFTRTSLGGAFAGKLPVPLSLDAGCLSLTYFLEGFDPVGRYRGATGYVLNLILPTTAKSINQLRSCRLMKSPACYSYASLLTGFSLLRCQGRDLLDPHHRWRIPFASQCVGAGVTIPVNRSRIAHLTALQCWCPRVTT